MNGCTQSSSVVTTVGTSFIWCLLAIFSGLTFQAYLKPSNSALSFPWSLPRPDSTVQCAITNYTARIIMHDPFMMHIENFISADERGYLLSLREEFLHPSKIRLENGTAALDSARNSSSAFLPWFDPVAQCIMHRAAELQGFVKIGAIENLQITAYEQGQKYSPHFDWFEEWTLPKGRSNRASTFFAILEADCTDCGTRFPRLQVDWSARDSRWCNFVDCNSTQGLTIEAVPGAALFWRNIDSGGLGNEKTLHEGLPVKQGSKIGLNIWTHGS